MIEVVMFARLIKCLTLDPKNQCFLKLCLYSVRILWKIRNIFFDQTWKRLSISLLSIKWLSVRDVLLVERRPTTPALELSSAPFSKARNEMIEFGKIALLASVIHMYNCNGLWARLYGLGVCYFVWLYFHHILDKLQSCPCI